MTKSTVKVEMELPAPPEGYEYTGEYRRPLEGEIHLDCAGVSKTATHDYVVSSYPILRKAIKYREPVLPQDLGKEVEFNNGGSWISGKLTGIVTKHRVKYWLASDICLYFADARIRDDA